MISKDDIALSMTVLVFASVFAVVCLILWVAKRSRMKSTSPPCMSSIPVLGSLPFISEVPQLHLFFSKQSERLGKVFSLYMGSKYTVVLNGRDAIYAAFVKQSSIFADRPHMEACADQEQKGLIFHHYNADFKKFHQLSLSILKEFGFGRGIMERRIRVEVDELIGQLDLLDGKATDPSQSITKCVLNVIASIIFGKRYEISDPKLEEMIRSINQLVRISLGPSFAINYFPVLKHLPSNKRGLKLFKDIEEGILRNVKERIQKGLSGEEDKSFISCYAEAIGTDFDYHTLLFTMKDLYLAGTETTSTTLQWMTIFMANHPYVQIRCQKEIDSVVSRSQPPSLDDKVSLPYVEATILELMRIRTLVPLGLPHSTMAETTIGDFVIPAGTLVISNLYSAHMDPEIFKDPETFCPERFLDGSGSVINRDLVIPFSLGKRSCLGEMLARQELFLFTTALLQRFEIRPPDDRTKLDTRGKVAVVNMPPPFQVRFVRRP